MDNHPAWLFSQGQADHPLLRIWDILSRLDGVVQCVAEEYIDIHIAHKRQRRAIHNGGKLNGLGFAKTRLLRYGNIQRAVSRMKICAHQIHMLFHLAQFAQDPVALTGSPNGFPDDRNLIAQIVGIDIHRIDALFRQFILLALLLQDVFLLFKIKLQLGPFEQIKKHDQSQHTQQQTGNQHEEKELLGLDAVLRRLSATQAAIKDGRN